MASSGGGVVCGATELGLGQGGAGVQGALQGIEPLQV